MSFKGSIMQFSNVSLDSIEKLFPETTRHVYHSRGEVSLPLNALFNSDFVHGMPEKKNYKSTDISFQYIRDFVDKATRWGG